LLTSSTTGIVVIRMVDASGQVSFVGTMYRAGRAWRGKEVEIFIVAGSLQMSCARRIRHTARPAPRAAPGCA
jgi:hypothetical protein